MVLLRKHLPTILVAVVTAAVTAGAPAIAHGVQHALFAHNADKVDGKHAVGSDASLNQRKNKLVAADATGRLPNDIIAKAPDSETLDGVDSAGFYAAGSTVADSEKLDGKDSSEFYAAGSTVADSSKLGGAPAADYQKKCSKGAVTGHLVINNPGSLLAAWTDVTGINSYNCTGQPIRIYRYGPGRYAVEFAGQEYMGRTAVVSPESGYGPSDVFANTSFVFHFGGGRIARYVYVRRYDGTLVDAPFQLVAFD